MKVHNRNFLSKFTWKKYNVAHIKKPCKKSRKFRVGLQKIQVFQKVFHICPYTQKIVALATFKIYSEIPLMKN